MSPSDRLHGLDVVVGQVEQLHGREGDAADVLQYGRVMIVFWISEDLLTLKSFTFHVVILLHSMGISYFPQSLLPG